MKIDKKDIIAIFSVALLVALLGGFISTRSTDEQTETIIEDSSIQTYGKQAIGGSIFITKAVFAVNGYVVVHEDKDGAPGAVIGSSAILAGEQEGIIVVLNRNTTPGEILWAMLHIDDGDGEYSSADEPIVNKDGFIPMVPFSIAS